MFQEFPATLRLLDEGPLRELRYETADVFLDDLSPNGRLFGLAGPLGSSRWLFRGAEDSTYLLVPSALRERGAASLFSTPLALWSQLAWAELPPLAERCTNREQYEAERRVLFAFFYAADSHGLPLPEDSQ